ARYWKDFSDFSYFRLEVAGVYFIGGFGVMGWVTEAEYRDAAPDPLAQAARGIIDHMNADQPDALKEIANRFGGGSGDEASMAAVRDLLDLALHDAELGRIHLVVRGVDREQRRANLAEVRRRVVIGRTGEVVEHVVRVGAGGALADGRHGGVGLLVGRVRFVQ